MIKRITPSTQSIKYLLRFLAVVIAAGIVALYYWLLADLPPFDSLTERMVRPTTQILDRNGRLLYEVLDPNTGKQLTLSLGNVPSTCIQATLATEDSRFYRHIGVDPIAIARAAWQNFRAGGVIVSGSSTLTMQLARNFFLEPEERYTQSMRRKLREAYLALRLEQRYTKDELLALYLNQTYYGNFAFGLEAAAQIFFAKPTAQLSSGECTLLAGLVQYPTGYNPLQDEQIAKNRQLTVLRLMQEAAFITSEDAARIAAEPLRYRSRLFDIEAPHFVMYIQDLLARQLGEARLRAGGLQVTTTLDLNLQRQAEHAIRYRLDLLNCRLPGSCAPTTDPNRRVDNAAAIILDSQSGEILAMVGSPDYFNATIQGNLNAALAERQPGSAIKPFTYAAALDPKWAAAAGSAPMTPATIIGDLPTTFYVTDEEGGNVPYTPVNYDRAFHGPVSVRTALANSYNIPAVKTLDHIGIKSLQTLATEAGISTFTGDFGLALTLGGGEVKLLDLAAAYGIFRNGQRLDTQAIRTIQETRQETRDTRYTPSATRHTAQFRAVIAPQTAYLITDILSDNLARIPAFGERSIVELPFPTAVKTGTTTDWRDNWTIGYSTERIVGIWVGNADNTPMLDVSGIDGAGPIWRDLMLAAHETPPPPFPRPDGIKEVAICAPSGLLPSPHCTRTRFERFIAGTEPTQVDNQFQILTIDQATGRRATAETPVGRAVDRPYWVLPAAYHDWMISQGIPIAPPAASANGNVLQGVAIAPEADEPMMPLVLSAPTSNTAYAIHPGVPQANQRIEVGGYVATGIPWADLRLRKDGTIIASGNDLMQLRDWWVLEPGHHTFWLEGRTSPNAPWVESDHALVVVSSFAEANSLP